MSTELEKVALGPLTARIDAAPSPDILVVLAHGYASPGDDLINLPATLEALVPDLAGRVTWVFPEGPLKASANPWFGRAWWQLELDVVERAVVDHDHEGLFEALEVGLVEAGRQMRTALDVLASSTGMRVSDMVLGGFSQGSMLMAQVVLEEAASVRALGLLSTTVLRESAWARAAQESVGVPTLVAHGKRDPLLPVARAEALADLLAAAGWPVERLLFEGSHKVPPPVHAALAKLIASTLGPTEET